MNNGTYAHYHDNTQHGDDRLLTRELSPHSTLDAVMDGVSLGKGSVASTLVADMLSTAKVIKPNNISRMLGEAGLKLHKKTSGYSMTTATVALKINDQLHVIGIGDSPAYLIRGGEVIELNKLDKGAKDNPLTLTRTIGGRVTPIYADDLRQFPLQPGDRLVLVTDGISDNIYPAEIADIVQRERSPQEAALALEQLLKQKALSNIGRHDTFGGFKPDDATAIIRYF